MGNGPVGCKQLHVLGPKGIEALRADSFPNIDTAVAPLDCEPKPLAPGLEINSPLPEVLALGGGVAKVLHCFFNRGRPELQLALCVCNLVRDTILPSSSTAVGASGW
jgi:hypothetical protein